MVCVTAEDAILAAFRGWKALLKPQILVIRSNREGGTAMTQMAEKWHRLHSKWGTVHRKAHLSMPREVWTMGKWLDPACWGGQGPCGST